MSTQRDQLTAAAFATGLILLVGAIAFWQAGQAVRAEHEAITGRAQATAAALADGLALDAEDPAKLTERFATLGADDAATSAITLLVPGAAPGSLRVVADWARDRAPQPAGVEIDAARSPKLVRGLREGSFSTETGIEAYSPVPATIGNDGGVIVVRMDEKTLTDVRRRAFVSATAIAGIVAVGIAVLAWLLSFPQVERRSTEPPPAAGDASVRRLDHLAKGMHERHYVKQTFGRYVSQRVADVLTTEHGTLAAAAEVRDVTLISGNLDAGRLATTAQPDELLLLANEWMGTMTDVVDGHGGMILNQHGVGFVAVFGAPGLQNDHALRAVRAAQTIRRRFTDLQRDWEKNGRTRVWSASGKPPATQIGVHSGRVVVGNLGTPMRVRYGALGEDVDRAVAVERYARETGADVLISDTVFKQLPAGLVLTEERGSCGDLKVYSLG